MRWMTLAWVEKHVPEAARLGVSKVARSPRGFVTAYRRERTAANMKRTPWAKKRTAFIARHLAQYRKHPTERRRLALAMWAYNAM